MTGEVRSIRQALEAERTRPDEVLAPLVRVAREAAAMPARADAYALLGDLAGRALGASWDVAERAAFALLEVARDVDARAERIALLRAMGRGVRNLWLLPFVHTRLADDDEAVVAAAIAAAGGLAFPALESTLAKGFLGEEALPAHRRAAIAALGRMGAESVATELAAFVGRGNAEAAAALTALTEIRSRVGRAAAVEVLSLDPPRDVLVAAVRYLAELGAEEVLRAMRRLARDDDPELRLVASFASRAFKAERTADAAERILAAITERDRAVRAALARRLRTLPVADVLEQARLLLSEDPRGVTQIVAEVRTPEVTRFLLEVASDEAMPAAVRARCAGSIEADEPWEREALVKLIVSSREEGVRVAAARTIGAFASTAFVLDSLASLADDPSPTVRAALVWALQLAARPGALAPAEQARAEAVLERALSDADPFVRRRAAYVAGNLHAAALVPRLVKLARDEVDRADLRVAAMVALGEIGAPSRLPDLVFLWNREEDPGVLGAASRAIERSAAGATAEGALGGRDGAPASAPVASSPPASLARAHDRLRKLVASSDANVRAAAARVSGLTPGAVPRDVLTALVEDAAPRVREQAVTALGRVGGAEAEPALLRALGGGDLAVQERAALALLDLGSPASFGPVLAFVVDAADRGSAVRVVERMRAPGGDGQAFLEALAPALERSGHDDAVYEPLLALKVAVLERTRSAPTSVRSVDGAIAAAFPTWPRLREARGFEPLAKSLRTAEMLYATSTSSAEADLSAAIVLWSKTMEGYLHAWLAPRMRSLQEQPAALWDLADKLGGAGWPAYQRFLAERWVDPVTVGSVSVEVPLRSVVNALRETQERRRRSLDSPLSITEWARLMLFFALDHASGPKNLFKIACRDADRVARLAHRLQVVAQVRNLVTHRSAAGAATLTEFRRLYYSAFEDLTAMA